MAGFGAGLVGYGEAVPGIQQMQMQQQQMQQDAQRQKLAQAVQQMNMQQQQQQMKQDQATQGAMQQALPQLAQAQGQGPGGTFNPQQIAQMSGNNPQAFTQLLNSMKASNAGMYGLQGREISSDAALERTQMSGENALKRTEAQQTGANQRSEAANKVREAVVQAQQTGANQRTTERANRPAATGLSPEYRTASKEFDEAKSQEQAIMNNYGRMGNFHGYLNDPQWVEARKRKIASQAKLEKVSKPKADAKEAAPQSHPIPAGAEKFPDGTEIPDSEGNTWVKQGNVLVPKQ
jgi:hypothetical protein